MAKIRVQAAKSGVVNGSKGDIYVFNPKGKTDNARFPLVDEADVARLKAQGFIAQKADGAKLKQLAASDDPTSITAMWDQLMAQQRAAAEEANAQVGISDTPEGGVESALASASTTAYPAGAPASVLSPPAAEFNPDAAPGVEGAPSPAPEPTADLNLKDLEAAVADISDVAELNRFKAQEEAKGDKARIGAIKILDARIAELESKG